MVTECTCAQAEEVTAVVDRLKQDELAANLIDALFSGTSERQLMVMLEDDTR